MKIKINIKNGLGLLLLAVGMLAFPLYSQPSFQGGGRQPFDAPGSRQALKSGPGSITLPSTAEDTKVGAGTATTDVPCPTCPGGILPPPTEGDKVGAPVKDIFWLWPLMAVGYGIHTGKRRRAKGKE